MVILFAHKFDAVIMEKQITFLEQGILTLDENMPKSGDLLTSNDCHLSGKHDYHFMETENSAKTQLDENLRGKVSAMQNSVYMVKEYATQKEPKKQFIGRNAPRTIAPKRGEKVCFHISERNIMGDSLRKRDRRRAVHNEVERRRRDKINNWIFKLKDLIPESFEVDPVTVIGQNRNVADSKSRILIRACEYIKNMQGELKLLRQCLLENNKVDISQLNALCSESKNNEK